MIGASYYLKQNPNQLSAFIVSLCPVWIIYEQVMIAALDCSRDDLALVSFQADFAFTLYVFILGVSSRLFLEVTAYSDSMAWTGRKNIYQEVHSYEETATTYLL